MQCQYTHNFILQSTKFFLACLLGLFTIIRVRFHSFYLSSDGRVSRCWDLARKWEESLTVEISINIAHALVQSPFRFFLPLFSLHRSIPCTTHIEDEINLHRERVIGILEYRSELSTYDTHIHTSPWWSRSVGRPGRISAVQLEKKVMSEQLSERPSSFPSFTFKCQTNTRQGKFMGRNPDPPISVYT